MVQEGPLQSGLVGTTGREVVAPTLASYESSLEHGQGVNFSLPVRAFPALHILGRRVCPIRRGSRDTWVSCLCVMEVKDPVVLEAMVAMSVRQAHILPGVEVEAGGRPEFLSPEDRGL
ncbi:hypothetical protein NDU88_000390 [Pleurodeles waltl]|uniref:Uncharacterized protein n=1 Tax=Pleurodeles waltl TaxID=8319 RepID=A0AAV7L807_PLEWA|nr:hypothetical protein NDU88_000390 [Pleurodeles waltl]